MQLRALSWNLFHGRDFPPDPSLRTWRSRLLATSERNATHVQVNRDLLAEFCELLAGAEWDVALLQECPPRWWQPLAAACEAEPHGVLTSRNSLGGLRAFVACRNPDLIASGEGGSNLTLVRGDFPVQWTGKSPTAIERRDLTIHDGRPERRAMAFTRICLGGTAAGAGNDDAQLCVANLHATNDRPALATEDVLRAAEAATDWAGGGPLIFGGDLNLRPARSRTSSPSCASASASPLPRDRTRSTTSWRAAWRPSSRRAPGRPSCASCARARVSLCDSPTTPPWKHVSQSTRHR